MGGETEAPRVGETVAVADHQARRAGQGLQSGEDGRDLPEREEPGTYGKETWPTAVASATTSRVAASRTTAAAATTSRSSS